MPVANSKARTFAWISSDSAGDSPAKLHASESSQIAACTFANPAFRSCNEDCAAFAVSGTGTDVLVVADGVGGSRLGQLASGIAVSSVLQAVRKAERTATDLRPLLIDAIEKAHDRICASRTGAATTLAVAEIVGDELRTFHCGDSLILVCSPRGRIRHLTVGHSPTDLAVDAGWLTMEEALQHQERHILSNCLGQQPLRIELGLRIRLKPNDTVVVATDGLFDNFLPTEISGLVCRAPVETAVQRLMAEAKIRMTAGRSGYGKADDLSVIVWRRRPARSG